MAIRIRLLIAMVGLVMVAFVVSFSACSSVPASDWWAPGYDYRCQVALTDNDEAVGYAMQIVVVNAVPPLNSTEVEHGAIYLNGHSGQFPTDVLFFQNGLQLVSSNLPELRKSWPEGCEVQGDRCSLWVTLGAGRYIWVYYGKASGITQYG